MGNVTRIAVDVAKAVFEIAVSDRPGHVARRERLQRAEFLPFMAQQPTATVIMEACGSSHHWGRKLEALGHHVRLLPPHHVRPYVRGNKTDRTDAKGILEASRNEDIHPVPVKTVAQQVLTSLHRLRSGWVGERTARINALRGLLRELGFFIPVGARQVVPAVWLLIEDADSDLPDPMRNILAEACQEIRQIEARLKLAEKQLEATAEQLPVVALLYTIPGIGMLTATALVAFLGDIRRFPSGRHLAQLPRAHAQRILERPQAPTRSHLQTRRRLSAHAAQSRRSLGAAPRQKAAAGSAARVGSQTRNHPRP
jgi:transposase